MNNEEVKAAKIKFQSAVAEFLLQFSAETGMTVTRVETDPVLRLGGSPSSCYIVKVEAQL